MELKQLRSALAVADLLHFSKAAERIHLSQPALSLQIRSLEEEIGIRLFDRTPQKTALTPAGKVYCEEARHVLACAERAIARARLAADGKIGRLRIGFISTAAAYIVPPLVAAFRMTRPSVDLNWMHVLTAQQIAMLEAQQIDIGFFRLPISDHPDLVAIPIHKEPFKLFVPDAHPLAQRPNITLEDLEGADLLVYSRKNAPGFHDLQIKLLRDHGVSPAIVHEGNDMYALVSLVAAGVGVTIAPNSLKSYQIRGVTVRDIAELPSSEIAMAFRRNCTNPVVLSFIRMALAFHKATYVLP